MERIITYTTASELKSAEEEERKRGHGPKAVRSDILRVEGSHNDIERTIERLKQEGHKVHGVTVQKICEHCYGRGHRIATDVSFDEVIHRELKPVRSEPTDPQMEASCIP